MKHLILLLLPLMLYSCCSTKQAVQKNSKNSTQQIAKVETPNTPETKSVDVVDVQVDYVDGKNPNLNNENTIKNPNFEKPTTNKAIKEAEKMAKEEVAKIYINTNYPDFNAIEVEKKITIPLEELLKNDKKIIKMESTTSEGYSSILIFYGSDEVISNSILNIKSKINSLVSKFDWPTVYGEKVMPTVTSNELTHQEIPVPQEEKNNNSIIVDNKPDLTIKKEEPIEILEVFKHNIWDELLQKHVSDKGNVNYKGFRTDITKFNTYLKSLSDNPPQESWNNDETLAYWMNVYNAFTIKLILDNYPTKSIKDINGPWSKRFIRVGKKWYTLNDVEHRIIRKMDEPRIHFALVCAAVSCPKLYNKAFTASNLERDLSMLTKSFLNDTSKNNISENSIKLSKIFKWYGGDFKTNGNSLIDFLSQYTGVSISKNAKKSYKDYNWALNE